MDYQVHDTAQSMAAASRYQQHDWGVAPWRLSRFARRRDVIKWNHLACRLHTMFPEDTYITEGVFEHVLMVRLFADGEVTDALTAVHVWTHEGIQGPAADAYATDMAFAPIEELYDRIRNRVRQLRLPLREDIDDNWPQRVVSALLLPELAFDIGAVSRMSKTPADWTEWEFLPNALRHALAYCDLLGDHVYGQR